MRIRFVAIIGEVMAVFFVEESCHPSTPWTQTFRLIVLRLELGPTVCFRRRQGYGAQEEAA